MLKNNNHFFVSDVLFIDMPELLQTMKSIIGLGMPTAYVLVFLCLPVFSAHYTHQFWQGKRQNVRLEQSLGAMTFGDKTGAV